MHPVKAHKEYKVYFGGIYKENWSHDYKLHVSYGERSFVVAQKTDKGWVAAGGDAGLCSVLNSPTCRKLTRLYFEAAAEVQEAVDDCLSRGLALERLGETFFSEGNSFTAAELMRVLMDEHRMGMSLAYSVVAHCCADIRVSGVDVEQVCPLQPRTAHVVSILRGCAVNNLAVAHNACRKEYRSPFGAVCCGDEVELAFRVMSGSIVRAVLILCGDDMREEYPMQPDGVFYRVSVKMPENPAPLWYCFRIETSDSSHWLCPDDSGYMGRLCGYEAGGFRLTVYLKNFETPKWFRRSVMYQIYPDRFAFSKDDTAKQGIEYHRALNQTPELHKSLDEPVRWQPRAFEKNYRPDDFYGGTLKGIEEKLPYLKELGISCIYLNPIVEARSNHRYDASDYMKVDPILGTNEDFSSLAKKAESMGMRIMLDGVFSHTGADSVYFNRDGNYPGRGACQSKDSEFYPWYDFQSYPDKYRSWWGFEELPEVDETNKQWQDFVISGENSVVKTWLRRGAAGWRLDVADELPDDVLAMIRSYAKAVKPDAPILGEVWEDAVIKESYGGRRNYALGYSLDSVMNYPFRTAALDFCHWRIDAYKLRDFLLSQQMNYPKPMYYSLMNLVGSHDTDRVRSALATDVVLRSLSREDQLRVCFGDEALKRALELEKLCAVLQFAIPGVPDIYYGDEQGMCGVNDPFNRLPFKESEDNIYSFYSELANMRQNDAVLSTGEVSFMAYNSDILLVLRFAGAGKDAFGDECSDSVYLAVINRGEAAEFEADCSAAGCGIYSGKIDAMSAGIIKLR